MGNHCYAFPGSWTAKSRFTLPPSTEDLIAALLFWGLAFLLNDPRAVAAPDAVGMSEGVSLWQVKEDQAS